MSQDALNRRYTELCARRDAMYASLADLQAQLIAANTREQQARREAMALALEISERKGGRDWIALKREIGQLAALGAKVQIDG